ncbi:MAG: hypothetical protein JOY99_12760 [Sphingomonadaceae bacterium]|nr:hypothetical protein [Sphingomonadaceae bacterium]
MSAQIAMHAGERIEAPALSALEWKVVRLALREAGELRCAGVAEPSRLRQRLRRLWTALTGWEPQRPLADPRLEMLRRFVCTARGRRDAAEIARRLLGMGFTQRQLAAVTLLARG